MFDSKWVNMLECNQDFTEIQKILMGCHLFTDLDKNMVPTYKFFQIKRSMSQTTEEDKNRHTLQFIDISAKIFYDDIKAQEEFVSLGTSTISHEMRNPLNSIISQC